MKSRFRNLLVLALCLALPLGGRAESWFQEAKRIKREADVAVSRSGSFQILPVANLTPEAVSAGAFFQDKGGRVIVRTARIHVSVPVKKASGQVVQVERNREQHYTGEPTWSGWWRDPWKVGYFDYTVTATYKGNVYTASFRISPDGVVESPRKK